MATTKERHIQAELMKDPTYAAAWENFRRTLREMDNGDLEAATKATVAATNRIYNLLDSRPDLAALAEAAEDEED